MSHPNTCNANTHDHLYRIDMLYDLHGSRHLAELASNLIGIVATSQTYCQMIVKNSTAATLQQKHIQLVLH